MRPFAFARVNTLAEAIRAATDDDTAVFAGGTELINWLKEGIVAPGRVVDINGLPGLQRIDVASSGLTIGALARRGAARSGATG